MFNQVIKLSNTCYTLIRLNLFWIIGLILGAVIFGVYPSTIALYEQTERFIQGYEVSAKDFFRLYFEVFKSVQQQNLFVMTLTVVLIFGRLVINNEVFNVLSMLSLVLLYLAFLYSVRGGQDNKKKKFIELIEMILTHPLENLMIITTSLLLFRISTLIKGSALVLSISLFAYAHIKFLRITKNIVDRK